MPQSARKTDAHTCPSFTGNTPHEGGPITSPCSPDVDIENQPASRGSAEKTCDFALCKTGEPDFIAEGSGTVMINNMHATRVGDMTMHAGVITGHASDVEVGGPKVRFRPVNQRSGSGGERKPIQKGEPKPPLTPEQPGGDGVSPPVDKDKKLCVAEALNVRLNQADGTTVLRRSPANASHVSDSPYHADILVGTNHGQASADLILSKPLCPLHDQGALRIRSESGETLHGVHAEFSLSPPMLATDYLPWNRFFVGKDDLPSSIYEIIPNTCAAVETMPPIVVRVFPAVDVKLSGELSLSASVGEQPLEEKPRTDGRMFEFSVSASCQYGNNSQDYSIGLEQDLTKSTDYLKDVLESYLKPSVHFLSRLANCSGSFEFNMKMEFSRSTKTPEDAGYGVDFEGKMLVCIETSVQFPSTNIVTPLVRVFALNPVVRAVVAAADYLGIGIDDFLKAELALTFGVSGTVEVVFGADVTSAITGSASGSFRLAAEAKIERSWFIFSISAEASASATATIGGSLSAGIRLTSVAESKGSLYVNGTFDGVEVTLNAVIKGGIEIGPADDEDSDPAATEPQEDQDDGVSFSGSAQDTIERGVGRKLVLVDKRTTGDVAVLTW